MSTHYWQRPWTQWTRLLLGSSLEKGTQISTLNVFPLLFTRQFSHHHATRNRGGSVSSHDTANTPPSHNLAFTQASRWTSLMSLLPGNKADSEKEITLHEEVCNETGWRRSTIIGFSELKHCCGFQKLTSQWKNVWCNLINQKLLFFLTPS